MTLSIDDLPASARKIYSTLLQGVSRTGLDPIAKALNCSVSTVSRMKTDELLQFAVLLAACDLKVVPSDYKCLAPAKLDWLLEGTKDYVANLTAEALLEDDPE